MLEDMAIYEITVPAQITPVFVRYVEMDDDGGLFRKLGVEDQFWPAKPEAVLRGPL